MFNDDFNAQVSCEDVYGGEDTDSLCVNCGVNHRTAEDDLNCDLLRDRDILDEQEYADMMDEQRDLDSEPHDIDSDFGYDPYAGGAEQDDYRYDSYADESDLWGEM